MTRVFLVDDHEIVRRGIADLINREDDLEVVGESDTARRTLARVAATLPDVVVLDVRLPDGSGIDLCRAIHSTHPGIRSIILTAYDDDRASVAAVLAGASGYVLKNVRGQNLVDSIRRVARDESLMSSTVTAGVRSALNEMVSVDSTEPHLTLRESQVLQLIGDGCTNREIGAQLGLAEKTIKNYVSGLFAKLGVEHRTQAAVYATLHHKSPRTN
ncbi:response regulator transcription factor [Salinibacterium sp. SWN139]|uniref:response regulator transcription factor n=1 Tax=Salinibacterium sp. SWN139 TaxID=2792055 RepID=UPI0018CDE86E|nr:response regulator transcription factor [Salinibacterium sp. SWN139]MBH0054421.1 response regulator transcription factor [Salinibacterium sp. SWN139]